MIVDALAQQLNHPLPLEEQLAPGGRRQGLLILGTRTFAEEVADLVSEVEPFFVAGFVDNMDRQRAGHRIGGLPIYWIDDVARFAGMYQALCGLTTTHRSRFVADMRARGFSFATVIHPGSRLSSTSTAGEGTLVSIGSIIASHSHLGRHVIVNRGAIIGHHVMIGDFASIMSGANIGGGATIGDGTYVGMSAIVLNGVEIGSHCVIGAGAVVTRDLPDRVQAVGVPARIVKENIDGL